MIEDSLATSNSFRSGGTWTFRSNSNGEQVSFWGAGVRASKIPECE
jgi:hypothetical protein